MELVDEYKIIIIVIYYILLIIIYGKALYEIFYEMKNKLIGKEIIVSDSYQQKFINEE